jgi:hypothetical protein
MRCANGPTARCSFCEPLDLLMACQMIFDEASNVITDARYSLWHTCDNVQSPKHIEINWPRDEYAMILDLAKIDFNKGISDDQFVLDQPEGTTLSHWPATR